MTAMQEEKGTISIHTENIFPIIKKFLYSDHEIFLRELVSNAVDATQKIKRLASINEFQGELGDLSINVSVNKKAKTITISDKGIGMTAEEIKKYINQIAFSGATEFVEKYKDKGEDGQIIGMFGLGFYSAFMVAQKVEIVTKSYQEGTEAARWEGKGDTAFEIGPAVKKERGTDIVLHVAKDSEEFLEEHRLQQILDKYCKFLPAPIVFGDKEENITNEKGEPEKDDKGNIKTKKVPNVINDTEPLWTKAPADLKDEDYLEFYKKLYPFSEDPLFWIHLNVDYPFNLTGILYFPKIKNDFEVNKNKIQLYSKQVFITDEVKDIVPEFLLLLHGVIDSPDIPLNVSRSYLQADSNVKKINNHITKKVADKLGELFKKERENYEKKWQSVGLFVKYGMISEDKFYDKAKDFALFENLDGKFFTINEFKDHVKDNQTDKDKNVVFLYTNDVEKQDSFIQSAKKRNYEVLKMGDVIDTHFVNNIEHKLEGISLKRVDSDNIDKLIDKAEKTESVLSNEEQEKLKAIYEKAIENKSYTFSNEALPVDELPLTVTLPEFMRRMKEMSQMGGGMPMMGQMPDNYNASINTNHPVNGKILKLEKEEEQIELAKQAFDLALLSQNMLKGSSLTNFVNRSLKILE